MSLKDWEKMDISSDEVNRIGEALKSEEFRKMFVEYCEEITDPENRRIYEKEITQLERERGVSVTFVNPQPGYVIKTTSDGTTKTFVNVSTSDKIEKPSNTPATNTDGKRGLNWQLPYTLSPPRRDMDKKSQICHVYDVVFHPDALHLSSKNPAFRTLVNDTAIDAIQQAYNVKLDRTNLKFPKIAYKGVAKSTVIRKRIDNFHAEGAEKSPFDEHMPPMPCNVKPTVLAPSEKSSADEYATPKYKVVQRKGVEFHEMTHELDAKINMTIPSEIVVTIDLPMLTTSNEANLDVTSKRLFLCSEKPAKYRLDIPLPYAVSEERGNAKFDKSKRQLIVTLPVVPERRMEMRDFQREDSGIESDQPTVSEKSEQSDERDSPVHELNRSGGENINTNYAKPDVDYILPNFTFNQIDEILAFTLHVKNVDPSSIVIDRRDLLNLAHIRFSSIGAGYFPLHYSFCVKFPRTSGCIFKEVSSEAWDNNVIFQFELNNYEFNEYEAGLTETELVSYNIAEKVVSSSRNPVTSQGQEIEDDSLSIEIYSEKESELVIEVVSKDSRSEVSNDEVSEDVFDEKPPKEVQKRQMKRKKGGKKIRSMSESYCDELKVINELDQLKLDDDEKVKINKNKKQRSISESSDEHHIEDDNAAVQASKYKSILKNRSSFSECNESSMDENVRGCYSLSADMGICQSQDSLSESCKKSVRFSDIIKRQLFR